MDTETTIVIALWVIIIATLFAAVVYDMIWRRRMSGLPSVAEFSKKLLAARSTIARQDALILRQSAEIAELKAQLRQPSERAKHQPRWRGRFAGETSEAKTP